MDTQLKYWFSKESLEEKDEELVEKLKKSENVIQLLSEEYTRHTAALKKGN